jgi:hypothetical protein
MPSTEARQARMTAYDRGRLAWLNDCLSRRGAEVLARELFDTEIERDSFVRGYVTAYWSSHDANSNT